MIQDGYELYDSGLSGFHDWSQQRTAGREEFNILQGRQSVVLDFIQVCEPLRSSSIALINTAYSQICQILTLQ